MVELLPRIISLLPVLGGHLCRTKMFEPDYEYTNEFLDLRCFDEVVVVCVDKANETTPNRTFLQFFHAIRRRCQLPVTMGGHIRSIDQAAAMFDAGADRILVGSAMLEDPRIIERLASRWGSQAVVGSVSTRWTDGGLVAVSSVSPNKLGPPASDVVRAIQAYGAGEVLINSVDRDGSLLGFDARGIRQLAELISVPFVIAGGVGRWEHLRIGIEDLGASGVVTSNVFHLTPESVTAAKEYLARAGVAVRIPRDTEFQEES